jgi:hypothetical protein
VPAPLASSAPSSSGWVVIPAPRPTSSTGERSNMSTYQPIRRRKAAANRPDIEPPMTTARRSDIPNPDPHRETTRSSNKPDPPSGLPAVGPDGEPSKKSEDVRAGCGHATVLRPRVNAMTSELDHERRYQRHQARSALPPRPEVRGRIWHFAVVPTTDSCTAANTISFDHLVGAGLQR